MTGIPDAPSPEATNELQGTRCSLHLAPKGVRLLVLSRDTVALTTGSGVEHVDSGARQTPGFKPRLPRYQLPPAKSSHRDNEAMTSNGICGFLIAAFSGFRVNGHVCRRNTHFVSSYFTRRSGH